VKSNRKSGKYNRKELNISITASGSDFRLDSVGVDLNSMREKEIKSRLTWVKKALSRSTTRLKDVSKPPVLEWKEQVARVGTGYRVRKDEKDIQKRRFDVGYADLKSYKRKEGREAVIDTSNMGRSLVGKGKDARVKVINAVCEIEKRRPASEYTGSGILRKSLVGKLKLKPTKPSGKE